jgi:hypothetical protein
MTIVVTNPQPSHFLLEARVISINARTQFQTRKLTTEDNGVTTEALQVNFIHRNTIEKLQELWGTTSAFIQRLFDNTPNILAPSLSLSRTIRVAMSNVYLNDKDIKVTVPEGLQVSYLQYLDLLEEMVAVSVDFYDNTLLPFKGWVGEVINDPSKIESVRGHSGIKVFDPDDIIKQRSKMFKGNATEVKYGQAFKRNSDWKDLETRANGLLTKMAGPHSPTVVNDAVLRLDASVGILIKAMSDPQKTYNASPKNVEALALLCYNLAKMIEFYGLTCYSIQSLIVAANAASENYLKARG